MKRGKDDEKIMGPMFPRLHVNDTEKGGPRAPPRNKMALYEQLSIPSQRFDQASKLESPSNQGVANERAMFFSYQLPTRHQSEKLYSQYSGFSIPITQIEQRKKLDEDDFTVPIFVQSLQSLQCGKYANVPNREKLSPSNPSNFNQPLNFHKFKKMGMLESTMRQEGKSQKEQNSKEFAAEQVKATSLSTTEKAEALKKKPDSSVSREPRDSPVNNIDRLEAHDIEPELRVDSQHDLGETIASLDKLNSSAPVRVSPSEDERSLRDLRNDTGSQDRSFRSVPMRNLERDDSVSETFVVDSISKLDIKPDDVVGIIGQRHFWKARKAILNQQRVFAIQVFELHRLVKVQRLMAASPQLLVDDSAYLGKPTMVSPGAKFPLNCPVKAIPNASKQKGEPEKPSQKKESSAENNIGKPSFSSIQNGGVPPLSHQPLNGSSPAPSVSSNQDTRPWCFNQPQGHQWLIPVMSPSEGLVYKPCPVPGFLGPACTGCRPPGPNPSPCNFLTPAYGIPAPHLQYQLPSFPPAGSHGYFPTYGVPIMNGAAFSGSSVEQMNPTPNPSQTLAREANFSSTPSHENRASPVATSRLGIPKDVEVQISTASSPVERLQDSRRSNDMEQTNVLPLFPMAPATDCPNSRLPGPIKVVPHNARSATESAARIFQSIQEERRHYDSV